MGVHPHHGRRSRPAPLDRDQLLLPQFAHALDLALDQLDLAALGLDLLGQAFDLLPRLGDPLGQLRLLSVEGRAPDRDQLLLRPHDPAGLLLPGEEFGREGNRVRARLLGLEPGPARQRLVERLRDDGEIRPKQGRVQAHQHVARMHGASVAHAQFADDAARGVLDLLDLRLDHEEARGDDRPRELDPRRPQADAEHERGEPRRGGHRLRPQPPCGGRAEPVRLDRGQRKGAETDHEAAPAA